MINEVFFTKFNIGPKNAPSFNSVWPFYRIPYLNVLENVVILKDEVIIIMYGN